MKIRSHNRFALLACVLLMLAIPAMLTWRAWRQEKLDQALIIAIKRADVREIAALLDAGANPNTREIATATENYWRFLVESWHGNTHPFHNGPTALMVALEQRKDVNTMVPQTTAIVKALLDKGADVNAVASAHTSALLMPLEIRVVPNTTLALDPDEHFALMKLLLNSGANPEATDINGETALTLASEYGFTDTVRLLLSQGANVNARAEGCEPGTPLACAKLFAHKEIIRMLQHAGATR